MTIRIMIADDHSVVRSGLRILLEKEQDFEVVAESGTGDETLAAIEEFDVDVVTLDISMPGSTGGKVAEGLLEIQPGLAIVVLTMHDDETYIQEFFKAGVKAFVLKKSNSSILCQAIRSAYDGEEYIDPILSGKMISTYVGRTDTQENAKSGSVLTQREREVCELLSYGHTNAEIAKKLHLSARTVETHRMKIMAKLDIKSRAELVKFAVANDLFKLY